MLTKKIFGVDLGASTVKIYSQKKNHIIKEKNMLAVMDENTVLAVGNDAYEMYEKAPNNIEVGSPISYGMVGNIEHAEMVLHTLLHRCEKRIGRHPLVYFAIPSNMSEIEKRAYLAITTGREFRKARVFVVERPIVDAIAMGIDVIHTKGSMVVNVGSQTTELSIIAEGRVIISKIVHIGGKQINSTICDEIRRKKNLLIGSRTARRLKFALADFSLEQREARKIIGINTLTGLPEDTLISGTLIQESLLETVKTLGEEIKYFIERTPPQITQLVEQEGVYLCGGCTHIPNFANFIANYIAHPVHLSDYYELCTIKGLEEIICNKDMHVLASPVKNKVRY